MLLGLVATAHAVHVVEGPPSDYIYTLPGWGSTPTPHWSGFLNASAAEPGTYLHYWFASSSGSKCAVEGANCPVVLWLNGGPGASSILGMLQEQGPLIIDNSGQLMENPYAWTTVANLLVVESPAGVGYSYCAAMAHGGACKNDDVSTAKALYVALLDFYAKFPTLAKERFYITGESYAGVYCPTLAAQIVAGNAADGAPRINLAGMAVGDPCTDNDSQRQSMDMLWYAHKNSFVPDAEYNFLSKQCGATHPSSRSAGVWISQRATASPEGAAPVTRVFAAGTRRPRLAALTASGFDGSALAANCTAALRRYLISSSKGISQNWDRSFINELSLFSPRAQFRFDIPGTLNYRTAAWMMDPEVRKALHVESAPVSAWPGPPDGWSYTSNYAACNDAAPPGTKSMVDFYRDLAPQLAGKIVVYNGDTDPCVSYEGTRTAIEKVGFKIEQPYRPWFFNFTAADPLVLQKKDLLFGPSLSLQEGGAQYGGEIVNYEHGLAFATVHGSGHMVPTFRPRAALKLLEHVVLDTPFAPDVPNDAALVAMSSDAFDAFLDGWVDQAESATFIV